MVMFSSLFVYLFVWLFVCLFFQHTNRFSQNFHDRSEMEQRICWKIWDNIHGILTHWGQVMHICVSRLTIIGSDNGLSPDRCLAIIWTNAGLLLIGPLETNFSENLIEIHTFSFKKMLLKMSPAEWPPFHLGLNVLRVTGCQYNLIEGYSSTYCNLK